MYLKSYSHLVPTVDCGEYFAIEGIDRECNFNLKYRKLNKDFLESIEAKNGLAVVYCPPMPIASAHTKGLNINKLQHTHAHKYVASIKNSRVDYLEIEGSACASSLVGIVKASNLIKHFGFEDVLVIADERMHEDVSELFLQMNIGVKGGDAFSAMHFSKFEQSDSCIKISNEKVAYEYNSNPWLVSEDGYKKVIASEDFQWVKPHGTGTGVNNEAEANITKGKTIALSPEGLRYKQKYGHMQGASGSTEICQMLDEHDNLPRTLCLAAGLGNFYAGLIIEKQ
jgi:hypothetical protein